MNRRLQKKDDLIFFFNDDSISIIGTWHNFVSPFCEINSPRIGHGILNFCKIRSPRLRAPGPFTIKQCNRVADAWSVVCGPDFESHLLSSRVPSFKRIVPPLRKPSPLHSIFKDWHCTLLFSPSFFFMYSLNPFCLTLLLFLSAPSFSSSGLVTHRMLHQERLIREFLVASFLWYIHAVPISNIAAQSA